MINKTVLLICYVNYSTVNAIPIFIRKLLHKNIMLKIITIQNDIIKQHLQGSNIITRARKIVIKFHNYSYEIVEHTVIVNSYQNVKTATK